MAISFAASYNKMRNASSDVKGRMFSPWSEDERRSLVVG
jgi:hypothetical protein